MRELVLYILKMEDYMELMPVILNYFKTDWSDKCMVAKVLEQLDEVIIALEEIKSVDANKEGVLLYYINELNISKKRVEQCINTVQ